MISSEVHPMDNLIRKDRMPHIWCSGCGLGTNFTCYLEALKKSGISLDKCAVSYTHLTLPTTPYV